MNFARMVSAVGILISFNFLIPGVCFASNKFSIAHLNEQGQDMVIIPLDSSFSNKSPQQMESIKNALQECSDSALLKGVVVPVWEKNSDFYFIAPPQWHPFFKSISMSVVRQNLNKELTCK